MIYKCKMCGGSLKFNKGETICTCEYCGTKQTLPRLDSEKKKSLLDRADNFRRNNDYDKASVIYEQILADEKTDSEVYWLNTLCRYGIEYVEDPETKKRIPTINRVRYDSILKDKDYLKALELANPEQKEIYEQEATYINKVQSQILEISNKEEPFDIFICYKETNDNGRRTEDSVLAQDIYKELTNEGYKVFFSRITLEDKLGTAYEPYIFAALNSARVMLVIGTKKEHFEAVWVKNEWSRYLSLIKSGQKKLLVPCYKNMNPYDLPEEFSYLQALDLNKIGYGQDLKNGLHKIFATNANSSRLIGRKRNTKLQILIGILIIALLFTCFLFFRTNKKEKIASLIMNNINEEYDGYCLSYNDYLSNMIENSDYHLIIDDLQPYDDQLFDQYLEYVSKTFNYIKDDYNNSVAGSASRRYYDRALLRHYISECSDHLYGGLSEDKIYKIKKSIIDSTGLYSLEDAKSLFEPPSNVDYESLENYTQEIILTLGSYNSFGSVDTSIMDKYKFYDEEEDYWLIVFSKNYIKDYLSLFNTSIGSFDNDVVEQIIDSFQLDSLAADRAFGYFHMCVFNRNEDYDHAFSKIHKLAKMYQDDYIYNYVIEYISYTYIDYINRYS